MEKSRGDLEFRQENMFHRERFCIGDFEYVALACFETDFAIKLPGLPMVLIAASSFLSSASSSPSNPICDLFVGQILQLNFIFRDAKMFQNNQNTIEKTDF